MNKFTEIKDQNIVLVTPSDIHNFNNRRKGRMGHFK